MIARIAGLSVRVLAASAFIALASPAVAKGLPPATPGEIAAGVQSCVAATSASRVDVEKLKTDGWRSATLSADGKPASTQLTFYGKGALLLTFDQHAARPICFLSAHIPNKASILDVGREMNRQMNVQGAADPKEADTYYWFPAGHLVQLKLTGKPNEPAVRVAVGFNPAEK